MAFRMAEGSVFAVLLRSPWWYSISIALAIIAVSLIVPSGQIAILVVSCSLPFFGIAGYGAYQQSKQPSQKRVLQVAQEARDMSATDIAAKIADTYTQQRFESATLKSKAAELELTRGFRKIWVSSKRFKAANTGIEPLKQLVSAGENAEVTGYLYVTLGEISAAAKEFAAAENIELVHAARLAAYFDGQAEIAS